MTASSSSEDRHADAALVMEGITRRFGNVTALDNASLSVRRGSVHALLGENGAGKTTLMRVAFGLLAADAGAMRVGNRTVRVQSPAQAMQLGIGMVHQHFTLVPAMTVAENVALGGHGLFSPAAAAARVQEVAARAGLPLDPHARIDSLSVGAQQRCEIVKALARDVKLLILDEPTAVLAPQEAAELLRWMRAFADSGNAVVLITHKLRDALAVADDVTVLRRGTVVLRAAARDVTQDSLREAMVGTVGVRDAIAEVTAIPDQSTRDSAAAPSTAKPVLQLTAVHHTDAQGGAPRLRDVSLAVHAGEIVGIAAVEGAGQHELLRMLAGRVAAQRGEVRRPDLVGFVPEDRHRDALMLDATLSENVALHNAGARRGRMPWRALRDATSSLLVQRDVRAAGEQALARTLSGGNQQKLVLGRELADAPSAIVVENPSRGLDFQATAAVHDALRAARDGGAAVVLYSSDLDEVLMLADRVFAMCDGRLIPSGRDRESLGLAMLGGAPA
jgi:simple sugar transport system ATP-binding protein